MVACWSRELSKRRSRSFLTFFSCDLKLLGVWLLLSITASAVLSLIIYFSLSDRHGPLPNPSEIPLTNYPSAYNVSLVIDISYDKPSTKTEGTVNIELHCDFATTNIFINVGVNLKIENYSLRCLNGTSIEIIRARHNRETEIAVFMLRTNMNEYERYILEITFRGNYAKKMPRLFHYETAQGITRYGMVAAVTSSDDKGLRYLIPCFDHSRFPATFTWSITRRSTLRSLTNMPKTTTVMLSEDKMEDHYPTSPPMKPSDVAIVLCDFQSKREFQTNGNLVTVYFRPSIINSISMPILMRRVTSGNNRISKTDIVVLPSEISNSKPGIIILNENEVVAEENAAAEVRSQHRIKWP